jgi:hypothetical protein
VKKRMKINMKQLEDVDEKEENQIGGEEEDE